MGDSDQEAWFSDGEAGWRMVKDQPLVLAYNNPYARFFMIGAALLLLGTGLHLAIGAPAGLFAAMLYILCAGAFAVAARYYFGERRIGALVAEISKDHLAVGCALDRIVIPWSAVDLQAKTLPIRDDFMAVPVRDDALDQLKFENQSGKAIWNRKPYARFIIEVRHNPEMKWVEIAATPNEFTINILAFVYPMIAVLIRDKGKGSETK